MRFTMFRSSKGLGPAVCLLAAGGALAQDGLKVSMQALSPIAAEWINAPPGTPGSIATHPAGPLTEADVAVGSGGQVWAQFVCRLAADGERWTVNALSLAYAPWPNIVETRADLLLRLTGAPHAAVDIDLQVEHWGDQPSPAGFQVDYGNDGTFDVLSGSTACCGTVHRRTWTWMPRSGDLEIRIKNHGLDPVSPQTYFLHLVATPWAPNTEPAGPGYGGLASSSTLFGVKLWTTNYQLAALPATAPGNLAELRATGFGSFGAFLISPGPDTVLLQLPPPFTTVCDVLANVQVLAFGNVTSTTPVPMEWWLVVPPLPPGLTFYVQHASAELTSQVLFGATNRVRFDT